MFRSRFAAFFRNLFRRDLVGQELDEELNSYADLVTEDKLKQGFTADQARRSALLEMEGIAQVKEAVLDIRTGVLIDSTLRDLRYGLRVLLRKPGLFVAASLTLALGIGAATTLYGVVESQLWKPLPFAGAERLVIVWERNLNQAWQATSASAPDFADWRKRSRTFESLSAMQWSSERNLIAHGSAERPRVAAVSAEFFSTLGIQVQLGRTFEPADERPGRQNQAIISGALSRRVFGSPQRALGQAVKLDSEPYFVIGVLPDSFRLEVFKTPDVFLPLEIGSGQPRDTRNLAVIGRLRSGVTPKHALADMESVARTIADEHPDTNANHSVIIEDPRSMFRNHSSLLLYFAFAVFVLLMACANVSCLQLMRSVVRQREFAIREALGAGRSTLLRQAIAESLWIGLTGAACGVLLAIWAMHALRALPLSGMLPRETDLSLDLRSILFAIVISLAAALLFGAGPGLIGSKSNLDSKLRDSVRSTSASPAIRRRISLLAGTEVTLAFISLFGAGLFLESYSALQRVALGFDPKNVLTMRIPLSGKKYTDSAQVRAFCRRVTQQASSAAGVQEFALSSGLPLKSASSVDFVRAGRPRPVHGSEPNSLERAVTPGYFHLLGIPIIRGRGFTDHDSEFSPRVALINENFARHFFADENPIGKQLLIATGTSTVPNIEVEIVGIAANTKEVGLNEVDFDDLYVPFDQNPTKSMYAVCKTTAPSSLGVLLRRKFQALDKEQFVADPQMLDSFVTEALEGSRVRLVPMLIFAGLSLVLTAIALYGTLSFAVAQRTREIGMRMALGARRTGILGLGLRSVLRLVIAGSLGGFLIAFVLGTILEGALYLVPYKHEGILYKVGIHDPLSFAGATSALVLFALIAGLAPALRATRIDPSETLRYE